MNDKTIYLSVASRGRNPENTSDRRKGIPTEQRLEVNPTGIANCVTTVAKDGWVLEVTNEKLVSLEKEGE